MQRPPIVVVTVDTEEDLWGAYGVRNPTVRNVARLPAFQELCDRYGARPTYFVNFPVVDDPEGGDVLGGLAAGGRCEIGTHIHAWNTPPFDERDGPGWSMLSALPEDVARTKVTSVHTRIADRFGEAPVSFRSGRWGFGPSVARILAELGYRVDSSVTPFVDWRPEGGPDYREAPAAPYRFEPDEPLVPAPEGALLELPATIGALRGDTAARAAVRRAIGKRVPRWAGLVGALDRAGLLSVRWLSPELASGSEMRRLATNLVARGSRVLNLTLHSPSLVPGLTPFVQDQGGLERFLARLEEVLALMSDAGWRFATVREAAEGLEAARAELPAGGPGRGGG